MGPTRVLSTKEVEKRSKERETLASTEKDDVELKLEKLLFGDEVGFLDALRAPVSQNKETSLALRQSNNSDSEEGVGSDIGDVPDEELFFLNTGNAGLPPTIAKNLLHNEPDFEPEQRPRTWYDSDDERITISLASNTRLRKLRTTEADDVVTGTEYIRRLRQQYERLHPEPEWVSYARKKRKISNDDAEDNSDSDIEMGDDVSPTVQLADLLRSTSSLIRNGSEDYGKGRKLRPEVIDIQRLKDVADKGPSSIDTLQFHPSLPLILSAGPSSTVSIHHLSPGAQNPNPLLSSLHIKNMPLHTAAFCGSVTGDDEPLLEENTRIFLSSRRRYFHTWSLSTGVLLKVSRPIYGSTRHEQKTMESFKISPCGRYMGLIGSSKQGGGSINVISTKTMQWVCSCKIDSRGGVADFAWWRNGQGFAVIGKNGEVSEYEIESRKVLVRWTEEGSVGTTVIAMGGRSGRDDLGGARWVAVGSSSGVVSIYDRTQWSAIDGDDSHTQMPKRPKPTRTFDQLTTPISYLEVAQDGQMLVMGSRWKKNALKLVHLPSCTIYQNWPTDKTPLGRISSIALSYDGTYLAVANEQGRIRLWQIRS